MRDPSAAGPPAFDDCPCEIKPGQLGLETLERRFGKVRTGRRRTRTVKLRNRSDKPLQAFLGPLEAPFELVSPGRVFTLEPGGKVRLRIRFSPREPGDVEAELPICFTGRVRLPVRVILTGRARGRSRSR